MSAFTRLGCSIWDWEVFTELSMPGRNLWLGLYTSSEAKRHVPGLWQGSIPTMADAARMRPDEARDALDELLTKEVVEFDAKTRVLRLCEFPDAGEFPSNGKVILNWWTKFKTVPDCPVRNAHVRTLAWLLTEGAKRAGKETASAHHAEAWSTTFGTIEVPSKRRRGLRQLSDNSDTGTRVQPSLFGSRFLPSGASASGSESESSYPQDVDGSVDNSASLRQSNEIRGPETVSDTVCDTVSDTNRIPDPGSRIPDILLFSERSTSKRSMLALVPSTLPYAASDVLREIAKTGAWDSSLDSDYQAALGAMITSWVALGVTLADFAVLGEYSAHSGVRRNARWLMGCDLPREISQARRTLEWRDAQVAMVRESKP